MVSVAARMIDTDSTPYTSLAVCHRDRGGCGERSPIYRTRDKARAWAERHREDKHPDLATEATGRAARRQDVAA